MPYLGRSSNFGVRTVFQYLPSAGDTSVSGADANGKTLAFADGNYVDVYLNGVKLVNGTDVTITSGTSVVLASGATAGDIVDIVGFGTFNVAAISGSSRLRPIVSSTTSELAIVTGNFNPS